MSTWPKSLWLTKFKRLTRGCRVAKMTGSHDEGRRGVVLEIFAADGIYWLEPHVIVALDGRKKTCHTPARSWRRIGPGPAGVVVGNRFYPLDREL